MRHKATVRFLIAAITCTSGVTIAAQQAHTNFVFFLVDDLGWADIGCFGSTFHETPHIDALAAAGMKFTAGYAACPVCSPTRASIMTGRHPVRVDITDWIPGSTAARAYNPRFQQISDRDNLALQEVTIAEALREQGYQTFFAGKWHLGSEGHLPTDQGFDINIGGHHRGSPPGGYYSPFRNPYLKDKPQQEYLTERLTDESISFLKQRNPDEPFLLYLSYYNVHTPIQPYRKRIDHYEDKAKQAFDDPQQSPIAEHRGLSRSRQDNAQLASMVAAVDDSVGRIGAALTDMKLSDNTVVIFFSDNGGLCTLARIGPGCNLPLRSGKGWLYEGGIREPMIIKAPGITRPGSVCGQPVISTDFFPTMLELADIPLQPKQHADGTSLVPLLKGEDHIAHNPLTWHYPHYHGSTWTPGAAIRDGDWKLIELYEFGATELYNLKDDLGETTDLSDSHPEKAAELKAKLKTWQTKLKARMPMANPAYNPDAPFMPPAKKTRKK
ncbi:MAG: sulfatase [Fuerstiella sp.]|nr:sulfatase [Fuerstiella sp.]MCP4855032.1 sulfatase [Fuerstiella sp.]